MTAIKATHMGKCAMCEGDIRSLDLDPRLKPGCVYVVLCQGCGHLLIGGVDAQRRVYTAKMTYKMLHEDFKGCLKECQDLQEDWYRRNKCWG